MGNNLSGTIPSTSVAGIDTYIEELEGLSYSKSLGNARFIKTVQGHSKGGLVVIKILVKPGNESFYGYVKALKKEHDILKKIDNVLPYQWQLETEKAVYVVRQYIFSNLYDRISTRPFLTMIEKKFIAFQLLHSLLKSHSAGIYHGDIKIENVLLTSWNWVYLSDFASYKPCYLPVDNPSDFTFYYDTSNKRSCYIAPERFYSPNKLPSSSKGLNEKMDVFSLGCVIAELFVENSPMFLLSQLLSYKRNEFDVTNYLNMIECEHIRNMVQSMIQLDPQKRLSAKDYLNIWKDKAFPNYFYDFLYPYVGSLIDPNPHNLDDKIELQADLRINKLASDYEQISALFQFNHTIKDDELKKKREEGAMLILSILTSSVRNCVYPSKKILGLDMLLQIGKYLNDEMKLDRLIPHLIALLYDKEDIVRSHTLHILSLILSSINYLNPINTLIFPEYLIPVLKRVVNDKNPLVRASLARNMASLAETANHFYSICKQHNNSHQEVNVNDFQNPMLDIVVTLLIDPESSVKRALLPNILRLCKVFGLQKANDFLLSHMITYLNDKDWLLRCSFFENVVGVGHFVGGRSLEEYILPLMIQAITDSEEFVVEKVLCSLTLLTKKGLFSKITLWDLLSIICPLLAHPNIWIRYGAISFTSVTSELLPMVDKICVVNPLINPFVKYPPVLDHSINSLTQALADPIQRNVYDEMLSISMQSNNFWNVLEAKLLPNFEPQNYPKREMEVFNRVLIKFKLNEAQLKVIFGMKEYLLKLARVFESSRKKPISIMTENIKNLKGESTIHLMSLQVKVRTEFFSAPDTNNKNDFNSNLMDSNKRTDSNRLSLITNRDINMNRVELKNNRDNHIPISPTNHSKASPRLSTTSTMIFTRTKNEHVDVHTQLPMINIDLKNYNIDYKIKESFNDALVLPNHGIHRLLKKKESEMFPHSLKQLGPIIPNIDELEDGEDWISKGTLIANLNEHKGSINSIKVSPDHRFFVTASDDNTIKIWDTDKLDKNVSKRSRLTYFHLGGRVICLTFIKNSYCIAAANDRGDVHVIRIEVAFNSERKTEMNVGNYSRCYAILHIKFESEIILCMQHIGGNNEKIHWIIMGSNLGNIIAFDLRSNKIVWKMRIPINHGNIKSMLIDPNYNWLLIGTDKGMLDMFDLRYSIYLEKASFSHPSLSSINQIILHHNHLVWLICGKNNDISLWDIAKLECKFVLIGLAPTIPQLSEIALKPMKKEDDKELLELSMLRLNIPNAINDHQHHRILTAHLIQPSSILVAGTDKKIRLFNLENINKSQPILPKMQHYEYKSVQHDNVDIIYEANHKEINNKDKNILSKSNAWCNNQHLDAINCITTVRFNGNRFIVSADRSGIIKVII